uniref:Uncharacterized protein n=1 Tax=Triticum aestivum TaxID=4565 RepID=A0A077RZM2_WHEAT|nr:unnamed protein product [Triticum aestivum]
MEILMEYGDGDVAQVDLMEFGWAGGGRRWTRVHELWGSICRSTTAYSHPVHWFCFHCHACSSSTCSRRHEITSGTAGHMKVVKNGIFSIKIVVCYIYSLLFNYSTNIC